MPEPYQTQHADRLDLPALAGELEDMFWRALLRPWPARDDARIMRIAATARLEGGLYITARRVASQVPQARSLSIWARTAEGQFTLLHYRTPQDFPEEEREPEEMGYQQGDVWLARVRRALDAIQPEQPASPVPPSASVPLAPSPAVAPARPAGTGDDTLSRWLRGIPRSPEENDVPIEEAETHQLPAVSATSGVLAAPSATPAPAAGFERLLTIYQRERYAAQLRQASAEARLVRAWAEATLRPVPAPSDMQAAQSAVLAEAWVLAGTPLRPETDEAETTLSPAREAACGSAREAVARLAAERAQVETWTSALAHLCQAGFSGHMADATGTCARCGSEVNRA